MPTQFTLPPDNRSVGSGNPPADMNGVVDALTAQGAGLNVLNAAFAGGADPTGVADSTAAIQAALNAAPSGGTIYLPPGTFQISAPLTLAASGQVITGSGTGSTTVSLSSTFSDPGSVTPGSFLAPAAFQVGTGSGANANNCTIAALTIANLGALGGSVPVTGINNWGCSSLRIDRIYFTAINGWAIEGYSAAVGSKEITRGCYTSLTIDSCAGGIHLNGDTKTVNSQASNISWVSTTRGTTTGPAANLDSLFLDSGSDFELANTNIGQDAGTGAALHLKNFTAVFATGVDGGGASGKGLFMEGASNLNLTNGFLSGYGTNVIQDTSIAEIGNFLFGNSSQSGLVVSTTASPVRLDMVKFGYANATENGRAPDGINPAYDLNWSGSAKGMVTNTIFGTQIGTLGTANRVQQSVNVGAGQQVIFHNVQFTGTGASSSNWFTSLPSAAMETSSGTFGFAAGLTVASTDPTWTPLDSGIASWTYDPALLANNGVNPTNGGTVQGTAFMIRQATTISKFFVYVQTAGVGLTSGQCYGQVYDDSGHTLGNTADQATNWASTGVNGAAGAAVTLTVAAGQSLTLPPGKYWAAVYYNGTSVQFLRGLPSIGQAGVNKIDPSAHGRCAQLGTGAGATPPSSCTYTPGSGSGPIWFAVG